MFQYPQNPYFSSFINVDYDLTKNTHMIFISIGLIGELSKTSLPYVIGYYPI